MVRVTAQAVTGVDGRRLVGGWDRSDIRPHLAGETVEVWDREVTYKGDAILKDILAGTKYPAYNLLANILVNDEKVDKNKEVGVYASGTIKELRVGKKAYRSQGVKYFGKR